MEIISIAKKKLFSDKIFIDLNFNQPYLLLFFQYFFTA